MILIGLQNAEKKYEKNRHNAGAIILKYLVEQSLGSFKLDKYTNSFVGNFISTPRGVVHEFKVFLPNTFMNLSGESVQKVVKNEKVDSKDIFVFFDDVTIPVGQFKISMGEGASSHNGVKSVIESLGGKNDFKRVRIGVGKVLEGGKIYEPGPDKLADFVLGNLNTLEILQIQSQAEKIISEITK
jgi:PTH1 family peptidyl-tRNA hydrolase